MLDILAAIIIFALWALVPILIGLLLGADRILTARLQGRRGPTVLQPLKDMAKLLGKRAKQVNLSQVAFAYLALALQAVAVLLLIAGGDVLASLLISGAGAFVMVLGAFSVRSPYSSLGAQRELVQILATEPVLLLVVLSLGYANGTFLASGNGTLLIASLPLAPVAMIPAFLMRLEKSPYDTATAHSELVAGPYTEYSGRALGIIKMAHWFELAVLFGILLLFFDLPDPVMGVILKAAAVATVVVLTALIDNCTARTTRWTLLRSALPLGLVLVGANLTTLYLINNGVI
ncbi:MAG: NADH-quinone oxidoreductase subunit H [Methanomassiliicoccus sp.]|nr:NADH-quinone oxidoreductase subunit H [Methanomassiliicoccus sp.]